MPAARSRQSTDAIRAIAEGCRPAEISSINSKRGRTITERRALGPIVRPLYTRPRYFKFGHWSPGSTSLNALIIFTLPSAWT